MTNSENFWDLVYTNSLLELIGDTTYQDYINYFSLIDSNFESEVLNAKTILEVGPGFGTFLNQVKSTRKVYAIEISEINRERLKRFGIEVFEPKKVIDRNFIDLSICLSVFQYCDEDSLINIFHDVYNSLKNEGIFYCNGIFDISEEQISEEGKLAQGRFSYDPNIFKEIGCGLKFKIQKMNLYQTKSENIKGWAIKFKKEE